MVTVPVTPAQEITARQRAARKKYESARGNAGLWYASNPMNWFGAEPFDSQFPQSPAVRPVRAPSVDTAPVAPVVPARPTRQYEPLIEYVDDFPQGPPVAPLPMEPRGPLARSARPSRVPMDTISMERPSPEPPPPPLYPSPVTPQKWPEGMKPVPLPANAGGLLSGFQELASAIGEQPVWQPSVQDAIRSPVAQSWAGKPTASPAAPD